MSEGELWVGVATCMIVGVGIAACGVWQCVTGSPRLLHGYHYATTPEEKYPALARSTGAGMIVAGVGCAALVPAPGLPGWLTVAGVVVMLAGIAFTIAAIAHFNGAIVSLSSFSTPRGTAAAGAIAVVALAAFLFTAVPGVAMLLSGDPSALHGYHLASVAAADRPTLARWVGAGLVALGVGFALALAGGAGMSLRRPAPRWARALAIAGGVVFLVAVVVVTGSIVRFNGTLAG